MVIPGPQGDMQVNKAGKLQRQSWGPEVGDHPLHPQSPADYLFTSTRKKCFKIFYNFKFVYIFYILSFFSFSFLLFLSFTNCSTVSLFYLHLLFLNFLSLCHPWWWELSSKIIKLYSHTTSILCICTLHTLPHLPSSLFFPHPSPLFLLPNF